MRIDQVFMVVRTDHLITAKETNLFISIVQQLMICFSCFVIISRGKKVWGKYPGGNRTGGNIQGRKRIGGNMKGEKG